MDKAIFSAGFIRKKKKWKPKNEKKIAHLIMESNNIKVTKKKIFKTSFTHFEGGNIYRVLKFMIIRRVYILFTNTKPFAETYCDNFYRILKQTQGQRNRGWGRVKSGANWHRKMCANRENNGYVNKEQSRGVEKNCLWFTTLFQNTVTRDGIPGKMSSVRSDLCDVSRHEFFSFFLNRNYFHLRNEERL